MRLLPLTGLALLAGCAGAVSVLDDAGSPDTVRDGGADAGSADGGSAGGDDDGGFDGGTDAGSASDAGLPDSGAPDAGMPWLWGLTTDDPFTANAAQVSALSALPRRATLRIVFDPPASGGPPAADYAPVVTSLSGVADVMGLPLDSSEMPLVTLPQVQARITEFGWGNSIPGSAATRETMIRRFMGYRVPSVPSFVGGGFYWHFNVTIVPQTKPDWAVMSSLIP